MLLWLLPCVTKYKRAQGKRSLTARKALQYNEQHAHLRLILIIRFCIKRQGTKKVIEQKLLVLMLRSMVREHFGVF